MAARQHMYSFLISWSYLAVVGSERWREVLLTQAHQRMSWLSDSRLIEQCGTREGIQLYMLKEDQMCAGDVVPVTFAKFVVNGVRPVDVFNTMLNTVEQKDWNPQAASITPLGDYPDLGARAYAVDFALPVVSDRELFQWQVADADFEKEEFWLAFSTEQNERLKAITSFAPGATESSNCLGAYHITKTAEGTHVVITQHVNAHPPFPFPLHQIMNFLPAAWKGIVDFVTELKQRSQYQNGLDWQANRISGPAFMLQKASAPVALPQGPYASQSLPVPSTTTTTTFVPKWFKNKKIPKWVKNDYSTIKNDVHAVRDRLKTFRENHFPGRQAKQYEDDITMPPQSEFALTPTSAPNSLGASPMAAGMNAFPTFKPKAHVNNFMGWIVIALVLASFACCILCCVYFCCIAGLGRKSHRSGLLNRPNSCESGMNTLSDEETLESLESQE